MQTGYDDFLKELDVFLKNEFKEGLKRDNKVHNLGSLEVVKESEVLFSEITLNEKSIKNFKNIDFKNIKSDDITLNDLQDEDKPREKLLKYGVNSLTEYELLAILLGSGSKKEDVLSLSKRLWVYLSKFQSVSDISISDLMSIDGIGISKASSIISAIEFSKRINLREKVEKFDVRSPKSVANIFMNILSDEMKEHFYVLLLNTKNKIISWDEISRGDLNSSIVHPREVFKYALKNSANSIICLHNHPSGDVTESSEDIEITKRLLEVGNLVGIRLLDHIIIGGNKYVSLREKGII